MLIAMDARAANNAQISGGGIYLKSLIEAIARLDTENSYCLYLNQPKSEFFPKYGANFTTKILRAPYGWTQFRLPISLFSDKPDIYFSYHHWLPLVTPKCKKIVTIHDLAFLNYPEYFGKGIANYLKYSTRNAIQKADKIITISQYSKNDIIVNYNVNEEKICVIYHGYDRIFDIQRNPETSRRILNKYNISHEYLFFLGDLHLRKNPIRSIDAFQQFKGKHQTDHKLVIAGRSDYLADRIFAHANNNKIKEHVVFTGYIDRNDLPYLMSSATALLFPSLFEGFGIPLLEAMASSTPIITSNITSMPEIVGDAGILIDPYDANSIEAAIEEIVFDRSKREYLIAAGLKRANNFSWDKTAKETLEVFNSL